MSRVRAGRAGLAWRLASRMFADLVACSNVCHRMAAPAAQSPPSRTRGRAASPNPAQFHLASVP
eukprot:4613791-Alexandrium_andersonii.AAC.1